MISVTRGSNVLINRALFQVDGVTPLASSSLSSISLKLVQNGVTLATLTPGSGTSLRLGTDGFSLDLELTSAMTATYSLGVLEEHYTLKKPNVYFATEPSYEVHVIRLGEIVIE